MEASETEWTSVDILHPEMLGKDDLIDLLSQKHIKVDHLHKTKDDILELFHRTVTPLPQREPRSNRRGRSIAQVQKKLQAKLNVKSDGNEKPKQTLKIGFLKSWKNAEDMQRISNASSSHGLVRLKPPPVVSSKQRTIRLNSSTSPAVKQSVSSSAAITHAKDDLRITASNNQASKDYFEPMKTVMDKSTLQMKTNDSSTKKATLMCTPTIRRDFSATIKLNACGSAGVSSVSDKVRKISLKSPGCGGVETGISKMGMKRAATPDATGKTSTTSTDENIQTASDGDSSPKKKIKRIAWP